MPHNPYTQAADAYSTTAAETDQRAMEGRILLKAAQKLEDLAKSLYEGKTPSITEVDEVMTYNQKLWQLFVEDMKNPEHLLPQEIKNNVASLALFVFKRTHEILIDTKPEKFKVLIDINRNIAAGLMKKPPVSAQPQKPGAAPSGERMTTDSHA